MSIFKSCDVRGIVGREWDVGDARRIGQSLGQMLRRRGQQTIVVGGDFRRSTIPLKAALAEGLRQAAVDVEDVGQVPTPVVQYAARDRACPNLAIVTASHNPGIYNGIKFLVAGQPPVPSLMAELESGIDAVPDAGPIGAGHVCRVLARYEAWVAMAARQLVDQRLGAAGAERCDARLQDGPPTAAGEPGTAKHGEPSRSAAAPMRVAVDTMGGAFTALAPRVLCAAGYETVVVDETVDPDFARRDPNPARDRNLQLLIDAVLRERADLGLALDGDGDRVVFVDACGHIARPEQIAALLIEYCYPRSTVVFDLKCASLVPRATRAQGGTAVMRPSGHGFIKATMLEHGADLGVEVSGHHFFGALAGGDDGLFTALVVLELLRRLARPLHTELARIGWPAITPDIRVPFTGDRFAALEAIAAQCGGHISRLDGVRTEYADGWALARGSITEPALTFRFEGQDRQQLRRIIARFLAGTPALEPLVLEHLS